MSVVVASKPVRYRIIIECDDQSEAENLLEFIGRSLDNGVLRAQFSWGAEAFETMTMEEDDDNDESA